MGTKIKLPSVIRNAIMSIQEAKRNVQEITTDFNTEIPVEGDDSVMIKLHCKAKVNLIKGTTRVDKKKCKAEIVPKRGKGVDEDDGE